MMGMKNWSKKKKPNDEEDEDGDDEDDEDKIVKKNGDDKDSDAPFNYQVYYMEESVIVLDSEDIPAGNKIAIFDMDDTLIKPKGKNKFSKGRKDWIFWDESVPGKLKELKDEGFKLVIITNQAGISKGKVKEGDVVGKIYDVCTELGFPFQVFMCIANDQYRKPGTEIFRYMIEEFNENIEPDLTVSFYCGDAAGRPEGVSRSKRTDHSCTDRKFAFNNNLQFHTPEALFLKMEETKDFSWGFSPLDYLKEIENHKKSNFDDILSVKKEVEMIILVGSPSSGKSSFCQKYLIPKGYEWINRDTLKNPTKCKAAAKQALEDKKSVVIDNTSPTLKNRSEYFSIAKANNVPCRCFYFNNTKDLSKHLNNVRVRYTKGEAKLIPDVAFNKYFKALVEPTTDEGFTEVREINFTPDFSDKELETIFKQYSDK